MAAEAPPVAAVPAVRNHRPGLALALAVFCVYGGLALTVDFPRAAIGIQSDEATYYMMGLSLAHDGDLTYRREDLQRVWKEFPSGPSGLFLRRGRDVTGAGLMARPPFVWFETGPDPDGGRFFYGKSFAYPVVAAPFVTVLGVNGFLVLHALLLAGVVGCAYLFLHARAPSTPSALFAGAFVLATVVPVYFVWITPELFNFSIAFFAYFLWLYKEVSSRADMPRALRWTAGRSSDFVAAILLGVATFSKVSNALLVLPILAWLLWRRRPGRFVAVGAVFGTAVAALFAINLAIVGDWNYQGGGDRRTYYWEFPFQTPTSGFEVGDAMGRDEAQTDVIFDRSIFWTNFTHNLKWYFVGRYSGLVAYFFPAVFAMGWFLAGARRRPLWQWLVLAGAVAQILLFIVTLPYTWFGGGGSVGNRYFMGFYGLFLFLVPPVGTAAAVIPWAVGGLFTAKLVLTPFTSSFYPGSYAEAGPLRLLPIELSNTNDLPINTDRSSRVVWFGDDPDRPAGTRDPGFQIYFLDRNAFVDAGKTFWVKGEARADFLVKTDRPMKQLVLNLSAGAAPTTVRATFDGRSQDIQVPAGERRQVVFAMGPGFPYMKTDDGKPRYVWTASISSSAGFVPLFTEQSEDTRFLGVRVRPMLVE